MRTLFQNTADRYTSRLPPPGVSAGAPSILNDSLRMVTAGASLYSSQQNALKPASNMAGVGAHATDYSNGEFQGNPIFDNIEGYYRVEIGGHIAYRYEIIKILGKGSFA